MVIEDGGQWRIVVSAFPRKRWAARVFRRSINMKSINRPCLSTARNRYFQWPPTFTYVSSTRHVVARDPLFKLRRVSMNPAHDRGRIHVYAPFLHHLRQIPVAYPILAVSANAHQDDIHRETTALEHEQGSSANDSRLRHAR